MKTTTLNVSAQIEHLKLTFENYGASFTAADRNARLAL